MLKAYLAGPISGLGYDSATDWRHYASARLYGHDILGRSPMRAKEFLKGTESFSKTCEAEGKLHPLATPKGVMTRDRYDATTCDTLLVNLLRAETVSIGTVMEIAMADANRIPIVIAMEEGNVHEHAMLIEAAGYIVPTLDDAIDIVIAILSEEIDVPELNPWRTESWNITKQMIITKKNPDLAAYLRTEAVRSAA